MQGFLRLFRRVTDAREFKDLQRIRAVGPAQPLGDLTGRGEQPVQLLRVHLEVGLLTRIGLQPDQAVELAPGQGITGEFAQPWLQGAQGVGLDDAGDLPEGLGVEVDVPGLQFGLAFESRQNRGQRQRVVAGLRRQGLADLIGFKLMVAAVTSFGKNGTCAGQGGVCCSPGDACLGTA